MRYAVIDLGSNSVRMVLYKIEENQFSSILDQKNFVRIIKYISNNKLSEKGMKAIATCINEYKEILKPFDVDKTFCFSTASLRYITNKDEVLKYVFDNTGINISMLSGEEEAYCDFLGAKKSVDFTGDGVVIDVGGGSCQIVYFKDAKIVNCASIPVGCLRLQLDYVKIILPTQDEMNNMKKYIKSLLDEIEWLDNINVETAYLVGGTSRSSGKLHRSFYNINNSKNNYKIHPIDFKHMVDTILSLGMMGVKMLVDIVPERLTTLIPGMLILYTVVKKLRIKKCVLSKYGIREGYLVSNIMNTEN